MGTFTSYNEQTILKKSLNILLAIQDWAKDVNNVNDMEKRLLNARFIGKFQKRNTYMKGEEDEEKNPSRMYGMLKE